MKKFLLTVLFAICLGSVTYAQEPAQSTAPTKGSDFIPADEIFFQNPDNTECASKIFADALAEADEQISENDDETVIKNWVYTNFARRDVLENVLQCPEIKSVAEDDIITFAPIKYTFPQGREVVINYETQPQVLKQKLIISDKRSVQDLDPNPKIDFTDENSIWTNTDPAWYAVMVVQRGALKDFVGEGKNNTISMNWIQEHADDLYPANVNLCTNKTAWAVNDAMINRAVHNTVDVEGDKNDYYVAGDKDLRWVMYAEMAADVAISIATFGSGAFVSGAAKTAHAAKEMKNLGKALNEIRESEKVVEYIQKSAKATKITKELEEAKKLGKEAEVAQKSKELEKIKNGVKELEQTEDVKKYNEMRKTYGELNKFRHSLRGVLRKQTGNVVARTLRSLKSANRGNKLLRRGAKVARSSMKSGRVKDLLFRSTMKHAARLGKVIETGGLLYGALTIIGDFWDHTEISTGNFTNNIDFKPLLLLSADDLPGQGNVVNYGMWLMWMGDSESAADDDAAYLQAMDFAAKFYEDLQNLQNDENYYPCDVDIYVVRPIIHNPGGEDAQLYYLVMNDEPWSTTKETNENGEENK